MKANSANNDQTEGVRQPTMSKLNRSDGNNDEDDVGDGSKEEEDGSKAIQNQNKRFSFICL